MHDKQAMHYKQYTTNNAIQAMYQKQHTTSIAAIETRQKVIWGYGS